jgi:translation initiation factor 1A
MTFRMQRRDGEEYRVRLPNTKKGEIFAMAEQLLGASRIKVMCEDGVSRMGRIPGKIKKRMFSRKGMLPKALDLF